MNATVRILKSNIQYDDNYTYIVPDELVSRIYVGVFVDVPFGNSREELGIVTEVDVIDDGRFKLKEITAINNKYEPLTADQIELAEKMAYRYVCSTVEVFRTMLSPVRTVKIKKKIVRLIIDGDELEQILSSNSVNKMSQISILRILSNEESKSMEQSELLRIADAKQGTVATLQKKNYVEIIENETEETDLGTANFEQKETKPHLPLNQKQQEAYNEISEMIDAGMFGEFLLHGITGSGKTEVYLHLLDKLLKEDKGAILLVPEIALTAQMIKRVTERFGDTVAILHSRLTPNEKARAHGRLRAGICKIAMGVRSAVFAPVCDLKLIIVDEEQEPSYKSFETIPYYSAVEVAKMRMEQLGGVVVYGSATPRVSTYYRALKNEIGYAYMGKRATSSSLPNVKIVDMKEEKATGNLSPISITLYEEMKKNLEKGEQSIIFVPRRGYSSKLLCLGCGKTLGCPHCRVAMSYHKAMNRVVCHYCGSAFVTPEKCPHCGSTKLTARTYGTEMIEGEIGRLFPDAKILRMDTDTTKTKLGHGEILDKFEKENVPFLVGTQMIAKGLDFPNVTLVGVVGADSLTSLSDYDASERAFVLLTQVFGRAGRAEGKPGRGIVETVNPEERVFTYAINQDYFGFYNSEIEFRSALSFPPFVSMSTVTASGEDDKQTFDKSIIMNNKIIELSKELGVSDKVEIMKVTRDKMPKVSDKYRWGFIIKANSPEIMLFLMNEFRNRELVPFAKQKTQLYNKKIHINCDVEIN